MVLNLPDVLAGLIMVLSALFLAVAVRTYRETGTKRAVLGAVVFLLFLLKALLYVLSAFYVLSFDITHSLALDAGILIILYLFLISR